ncbi:MAG: Calx-beta domain-containing protein [Caldilineaceae bacterium]
MWGSIPVLFSALSLALILWLGGTPAAYARDNAVVTAASCPGGSTLYVNDSATGAESGDSWQNAFTTLQDALTLAATCPTVSEIWVAQGVYYPDEGASQTDNDRTSTFQLRDNLALYGGFAGTETFLNERDWQNNVTVLSGDLDQNDPLQDADGVITSPLSLTGLNAYRVVLSNGVANTAILDGFTITGGKAEGAQSSRCNQQCGGGMNNDLSSPVLRNLRVIGNYAANHGGGMYNLYSQPILENVTFKANYSKLSGGGMYNNNSSPTMTNSLFSGNLAASRGGAIYNNSNSSPLITNATISGNRASGRAGAIYNDSNSNPTLTNTILWDNSAAASDEVENSGTSFPVYQYSLLDGAGGSSSWNSTFGVDGGNNVDADPNFTTPSSPSNAPTTAGDLHLLAGSLAVDRGDSSTNLLDRDLENAVRHQSAAIDLGAYETAYTAQLAVGKWLTPATIEFHETVTYTIAITNSGDAYAYHTLLTDTLPGHATFAGWVLQPTGAAYTGTTNTIAWAGTVAASETITFTFVTTHTGVPDETVTNTVTITHPTGDANASATFVVDPLPTASIADTTTDEATAQATFTVTLSTPTRKTVTLTYATSNGSASAPGDFTAVTDSVTFAPGVQTAVITIPVNNDAIDENSEDFTVTLSDPVNALIDDGSATATIADDDTAGNSVTPTSLTVREPSESIPFTITLTSQPIASVRVTLRSSDTTECSVPSSVTLNAQNWQSGVVVNLTAVDDDVVDGDQPCTIQTVVSSADPLYDEMVMADVSATVESEDVAGVAITPDTVTVAEPATSALFTVTLTSQPLTAVQINLASTTLSECTVPTSVTVTAANWRQGVTVPVIAVDDDVADGEQNCTVQTSATSSDVHYNGIAVADVPVTVQDNDVAGVAITPTILTLSEPNGSGSFSLNLTSKPRNPVTVRLTSDDTGECRVSNSSVTLDSNNWNVSVVVPVNAVDDEIDDSDQLCTINTTVTSNDIGYNGLAADDIAVTVQDDSDTAGMTVSTTALTVTEPSGTASYVVALTSQPVASVVVHLTTTDPGECTVPASVTLTSSSWKTGKSVTVTAVDDHLIDDAQSCVVQATATSNDANYAGMSASDVAVTVQDEDTAGVVFTLDKESIGEASDSALLVAKLTSQPVAAVTIGLISSDTSECTIPNSMTLDASSWNTGVGVTIQSVDDHLDDEAQPCTIQTTATSADSHYNALAVEDIALTVEDDETAGFVVTPATLTVSEPATTADFTVALTSQPTATVTIALTSSDESECSAPATIVLNQSNWQSGVTATIQANDDRIADDARLCMVTTVAGSTDGDYNGLALTDLAVTVQDNDTAGVTVAPTALTVQEPDREATFTVALTSQPTATVTVNLSASDVGECTMPASVSLDETNWEQGIAVTVTALDDAIDDGDQACVVQTAVGSPDTHYAAIAAADVAVTVADDNDTAGVIIATTVLTVSEPASSTTFTVVLTSEPTASVTMTVTPENTQCTATPAIVFTAANWQQAQTVTVTAVDDQIVDGARPCTVQTVAHSADANYQEIAIAPVAVTVLDDGDTAGVVVTPTQMSLSEANGETTVTIALTSQPTATVQITLASDDPSECRAPEPVMLDATNWLTGTVVTLAAVDDQLDDGDQSCHIQITADSTDLNYHAKAIEPIALTIQDNDLVTMQVAAWSNTSTVQLGEPLTYTYRLTNTGDVTLTVQAVDSKLGPIVFGQNHVPPKGTVEGVLRYTVQEADAPGPLQTTVTASATATLGTPITTTTATAVAITVMPEIEIAFERLSPPHIVAGSVVTYGLTITNAGFVDAVVESIDGAPKAGVTAATVAATTCAAPLTIGRQSNYYCLLAWEATQVDGNVVEFAVTVKVNGPLQSSASFNDSAIVVIGGPTEAAVHLFLPIIKR